MDCISFIDKYYHDSPDLKEVLVTHSRQVRDRALYVASLHPGWSLDLQFIEEAAMLHDIGIFYCHAPNIHCHGTHKYIEHGYLGAELLRQEGLPKHALVAERHTGSGITMEQVIQEDLPIPVQDYLPITLEEKIICYADKFYSKGHLGEEVPVSKIRLNMWKYGQDAIRRWDELVKLMAEPNRD